MSWGILVFLLLVLGIALLATSFRRVELRRMSDKLLELQDARERGSHRAQLQYPNVDLSRCLGCGTCVQACPEEGVLEIIHGQAIVVHGARCVGHGLCAKECPTGAITVALGDMDERRDIPAVAESFEATGVPGLFLAGEVTGYALIRTAIAHGTAVASEVSRRIAGNGFQRDARILDLCVIGAGPAGLACSLQAKADGLSFLTLEQELLGGTVAKYPRRKLVMTQPVDLPLHGRLTETSYHKEELMDLWEGIAQKHELPVETGVQFQGVEEVTDGVLQVNTNRGTVLARNVCLAIGRRGTPRKLGVQGEDLPKVAYSLLDAQSYQGRRILVVGGGDSAIEAALGLAEQPGNAVTLSYRRHAFFRLKARNERRLQEALEAERIQVLFRSQVTRIDPAEVELSVEPEDQGAPQGPFVMANDEVFVLAGGIPPFKMLEESGVSFDPADRAPAPALTEEGTGLLRALAIAFAMALVTLGWALFFRRYYGLPMEVRPSADLYGILRPSGGLGLAFGLSAAGLICCNLLYLVRRSARLPNLIGSLQGWMTAHVATGILSLLLVLLHAGMQRRSTVGSHAMDALAVLLVTGAVGRYFYSFIPRAANGRELAIEEVKTNLASVSSEWDQGQREFGQRVRAEIEAIVENGRWRGNFVGRVFSLLRSQRTLRAALSRIEREGREQGLSPDQIATILGLARRAQRTALMAAHYEDLRGLMATWRYVHRWAALMMVLLVITHVVMAVRYGALFD